MNPPTTSNEKPAFSRLLLSLRIPPIEFNVSEHDVLAGPFADGPLVGLTHVRSLQMRIDGGLLERRNVAIFALFVNLFAHPRSWDHV